jgi:hypothetical protein
MLKGVMPKTTNQDFFLKRLRELDGSAGNKALRENLGWDEEKYFRVRKFLIEEGLVEVGQGKGGSVHLLGDVADRGTILTSKSPALDYEKDHYPHVVAQIEKRLKQDFTDAVVEQVAHQGGKAGKWMHPDILALTFQRFEYVARDVFALRSYEIKRSDVVDTDAVAEAAAHRRLVQLAYLVIVPHGDDKIISEPTNLKRRTIEKECLKAGVGLILIPDYKENSDIEIAIEAASSHIDDSGVNATIGLRFSEQKRKDIKKLIHDSRLGELKKIIA